MDEYATFSYGIQATVLGKTDLGIDGFIEWWCAQVAAEFDLDQATLNATYSSTVQPTTDYYTR
jgi:hypothetical protein